jgi:4-hydroxy-2-oxoheptanedioate aldolase
MAAAAPLASRLRAGEALLAGWSSLTDPVVAEVLGRQAFDCVLLDMQHGLHDIRSVGQCLAALALAGKPGGVRVPLADNAAVSRALDLGAAVVIAPMINSATEARTFVAAAKYPPVGERSWGPTRALALSGRTVQAHLEGSNTDTLAFAMIETDRALSALPDILAVPGLDGVFVGPNDMSVALSGGRSIAPGDASLDAPLTTVIAAAANAGKLAGIYAGTAERARHYLALGYRLIALGADTGYMVAGATELLAAVRRA